MKVKCIDADGTLMERGEIFEGVYEQNEQYIKVRFPEPRGDNCQSGNYLASRFEVVPEPEQIGPPKYGDLLPTDSAERKKVPIQSGCLDYFPSALIEVAKLSYLGNEKHNPGEPLHHARGKSMDHGDALQRHQMERDQIDPDTGLLHAVEVAWRALAQLQELLEARGAPKARGAK